MPKKDDHLNKIPLQEISDGDFQEYVAGKKARRKMKARRGCYIAVSAALMFIALAAGYIVMEAMLRVSETPLPEETRYTQAPSTTEALPTLPEPEGPPMRSFYIPIRMLDNRDQSAEMMSLARRLETNTAVMTFKDSNGWLSYRSNLMQMQLLGAAARARFRTDWTLFDMKFRAEQRVIAVINCFNDPLAAGLMTEAAVLREGTDTLWTDAEGRAWLNPWSEAAREYLLAVIREVAAFGQQGRTVDDILLAGVSFPPGDLSNAAFPGIDDPDDLEARNAILRSFIEEAKEAAGEEATLYVMLPHGAAENSGTIGGDLWNSAADVIAIDVRGSAGARNEAFWRTRRVVPVVAAPEDAEGMRDYIVLQDDAQE